jgi:hypothetical protein
LRYEKLPAVGSLSLPQLSHFLAGNSSSRFGAPIQKVWVHRWGGGSFSGVESWFQNPRSDASAHLVYAGETGRDKGKCVQMVGYGRKAWTESFYNRTGVSIECADAMWLGKDPVGFARAARIVAFLLHDNGLPAHWVHGRRLPLRGFLRHADGLARAGGHTSCPTTDMELWWQFVGRVKREYATGHFRRIWGRR